MDGGTTSAVTCRGVEGCAGGETSTEVLPPGSPGTDASALTSEKGKHDEAQHEVATVPGVATTADFFGGGTIQTNLPNAASSESVAAATTEEQQKQAAGDVSAAFTPESVADLLAQLEARKKAKDEDRLCNTEKEQECYQPCKDRNDCAQESGDDKEECKQNCRAKCCKAKDKNLHLFTKKEDSSSSSHDKKKHSDDSSPKKSQDTKKKKKRSSAASEFERMCNTAPERRCREQCFRDKSCGSSDSEDDETCKKRCRSKCCSFSRNKAKQGDAIKEANERLCNTSDLVSSLGIAATVMTARRNVASSAATKMIDYAIRLKRKVLETTVLRVKDALAAMMRRIAIVWPFAGTKIVNLKMQASSATCNLRPRAVTSA